MRYLLTAEPLGQVRFGSVVTEPHALFSQKRSLVRLTLQRPLLVLIEQLHGPWWGLCQVGLRSDLPQGSNTVDLFDLYQVDDAMLWLQRQWLDTGLQGRDFRATLFEVGGDDSSSQLTAAKQQLQHLGVQQVETYGALLEGQTMTFDFRAGRCFFDGWHGVAVPSCAVC